MKKQIRYPEAVLIILLVSLSGGILFAAEFEILDKFSVDGYSVLKGSAAVNGAGVTGASQIFTVASSTFNILANGNVGIGQANPVNVLHVTGNVEDALIRLHNNSATFNRTNIRFRAQSPANANAHADLGFKATGSEAGYFFFKAPYYSTERMAIDTAGNVGIGTTGPYSKLNIADNGTLIGGKGIILGTVGDGFTTGTSYPAGTEMGRFEIGFPGWRDVEPYQIGAKIAGIRVSNHPYAYVQATELGFYTGGGGTGGTGDFHDTSSERMRINMDGNVGIGTTAPITKLDVQGTINSGVNYVAGFYAGAANAWTDGAAIRLGAQQNSSYWDSRIVSYSYAPASYGSRLHLQTHTTGAGSELWSTGLLIDEGGNVGIGTTSPGSILTVNQDNNGTTIGAKQRILLQNNSTTASAGGEVVFGTYDDNVRRYAAFGSSIVGNDGAAGARGRAYIATKTNSADTALTERVSVQENGNVGIGTTGPADILDVQKNQNATTNFYFRNTNNTNANSRAYINLIAGNQTRAFAALANNGGSYIGGTAGTSMYFQQNLGGAVNMTIDPNGNVGIGTTGPGSKLQVKGTDSALLVQIAGAGQDYLQVYSGGTSPDYGVVDGGAVLNLGTRGGSPKYLSLSAEGGASFATIAGNVGIGTTNPGAKLDVNGSIKVTSRIVNWQSACISGNICGGGTINATVLSGADYGQIYNGTARISVKTYSGDGCANYYYTLYPTMTVRDSPAELYLGASPNPCPTASYVVQASY